MIPVFTIRISRIRNAKLSKLVQYNIDVQIIDTCDSAIIFSPTEKPYIIFISGNGNNNKIG